MSHQIFVNLPVTDLKRSMEFYAAIGFTNNPDFTDDKAACMVLSEHIFVMLLSQPRFKDFTNKEIADTKKLVAVINCLSMDSPEAMNAMANKAIAAGGHEYAPAKDLGFMQQRCFEDPDGHNWEVVYMNMNAQD